MMRLFANKRGLDYATFLTLATLVIVVYLFIALSAKVEPFQVQIGEYQVAVLNAYQDGENALLYVDQAAKMAAYRSLHTLATTGGMLEKAPCGMVEYAKAWTMRLVDAQGNVTAKNCVADVTPYEAFSSVFNRNMNVYLDQFKSAALPADNYELFIRNDTLTGTAVKPALVWVRPPPGQVQAAIGPFPIPGTTQKLVKAPTGAYNFLPSFTVPVQTQLEVYDDLKQAVTAFYQCTKNVTECIDDLRLQANVTVVPSTQDPAYVIVQKQNPVKNPYAKAELPPITFALYVG